MSTRRRGTISRVLSGTARQRIEVFHCQLEVPPPDPDRVESEIPDGRVLAVFAFDGEGTDPLLMWDGLVPVVTDEQASLFFDGNLQRWKPPELHHLDATGRAPSDDSEFWPAIDVLERRAWENTLPKAVRVLAGHDIEWLLRWAETAALHALALTPILRDRLTESGLDVRDEPAVIGSVLLQGRETYELVLSGQRRIDDRWISDLSAQTIWLASHALDRKMTGRTMVETSYSPRHREIDARGLEMDEAYRLAGGYPADSHGPSWVAARTVVALHGGYRERVVWFDDQSPGDDQRIAGARAAVEHLGGRVVAGPEFDQAWCQSELWSGEVFRIRRRITLNRDDYAARFTSVP